MTSTRTQSGPISPLALLHELADNWWLVLLRGIAAIAFGILAFFWPAIALVTLVFLWGTYALVDGVFALAAAIAGVGGEVVPRWWLVLVGIDGKVKMRSSEPMSVEDISRAAAISPPSH